MTHPIDTVIVDGVAVSKADLRAELRKLLVTALPGDAQSLGLTSTLAIITVEDGPNGIGLFIYDSADTTSTHDPAAGVLVSSAGRRYKRIKPEHLLTSALVAGLIDDGAQSVSKLADGTANRIIGYGADQSADLLTSAEVIAAIDAATGSTVWRTPPTSFINPVLALPVDHKGGTGVIGARNSVLLMRDGTVKIAGQASSNSLGPFTTASDNYIDLSAPPGVTFTKIYSGYFSVFAIDSDGYPWVIGRNDDGHFGVGDTNDRSQWTRIPFFFDNTITVTDIHLNHPEGQGTLFCALFIATNGTPYFAGDNTSGAAGDGSFTSPVTTPKQWGSPTFNLTNVQLAALGAGGFAAVMIKDSNNLYVSGSGSQGKLGDGGTTAINTPVQISFTDSALVTQIVMSPTSTNLVLSNGQLWRSGEGGAQEFADGLTTDKSTFTRVDDQDVLMQGLVSEYTQTFWDTGHACAALTTAGRVVNWGSNASGVLGRGTTGGTLGPAEPSGSFQGSATKIRMAGLNTEKKCYIQAGNDMWSCGDNTNDNIVNGVAGGAVQNTLALVQGMRGTIQDWRVINTETGDREGLIVLTTEALLVGGGNLNGQLGGGYSPDYPIMQVVNLPVTYG